MPSTDGEQNAGESVMDSTATLVNGSLPEVSK